MSEGPIKRERAAWEPPRVSTKPGSSTHLATTITESGVLCGRRVAPSLVVTTAPTCADCAAAERADREQARS